MPGHVFETPIVSFRRPAPVDFAPALQIVFARTRVFQLSQSMNIEMLDVDDDRNDADDEVDVAGALKHSNQLRADFDAGNGAERHD